MNPCESTTGLFSDYYDGGLAPAEREALEEHLRACASCRVEYEAFTRSLQVLHDTEPLETTQVFVGGVRAAVQEELRRSGGGGGGRAPAWVPWALAGVLAAGFGAGILASSRRPHDRGLARSLEQLREELARRPGAPPEAGPVPAAPVDEASILARHGMVPSEGGWIPRIYDQAFREGKVFLGPGKAVTRREAALELEKELPARPPAPAPPAGGLREEEVFERYGLVRHEGAVLPRAWLERWTRGEVLVGVDRWRTAADFKADLMREHDLVERGGRLMSRREAEEVAARRRVRRPESSSASNVVTAALEELRIGVPVVGGGMTVYPLIAEKRSAGAVFRTLQEAMRTGNLDLADREGFFSIQARHQLDADVFLLAGQVLQGGRCDRVVRTDTWVPAGRTAAVPVLCVEPGAWRGGTSKFARESGHYVAPPSVRRALTEGGGQAAVWAALRREEEKGGPGLVDRFRRTADRLAAFREAAAGLAEREPGTTGLAVAWGGGVWMAELFAGPEALAAFADRLVQAAALEVLEGTVDTAEARPPAYPDTVMGVKQFLEGVFTCAFEVCEGGLELRREAAVAGRASLVGGELWHAVFFAPAAARGGRRGAPGVPREKLVRLLAEYEARMVDRASGPLLKAGLVREAASIGTPEAVAMLLRHVREPDLSVRRVVIRELGTCGDPAAVKDLLELLKMGGKDKDPVLYAEVVRALARIGDERAVPDLLRQMDGGDAEAVRVVVQALPELLLQLRSRDPLDRAVRRLMDLYAGAEAAACGDPMVDPAVRGLGRAEAQALAESAQGALRQVTGLDFDRPSLYLKWWNDRAGRERFLRERTGR